MFEDLGLTAASFFMLAGAFFLYDGISTPDSGQVAKIIVGSVLFSGGLMVALIIAKNKIVFRRRHGRYPKR